MRQLFNYQVKPEGDDNDEDIVIRLHSKDPHKCKNITRFNYIKMDFIPVKLRFVNYILNYIEIFKG